ncbi:MAG TPA: SDR family NAD(P)-dependent oxidoreductase [Steroidobacteraceae bacterium]|jgi:3-oxoacyl-[acyl-carrier protein] reductase|nr:SDR family NAD(P)-dependent oxidoreductase [Steroidobacteraceae bacterium]
MHDFHGRVLLLTGAKGDIGRAVAQHFFEQGAFLVLAGHDRTSMAAFGASLTGDANRIATLGMNASDPNDSARAVALAEGRFGGIDFLVPLAGAQPIATMTVEQWRHVQSVNLDGVFYICQRSIRSLREGSAIVIVSSIAAHRGAFCNAHYAASKGGLPAFTRSLARELGPRSRVNAVSPGIIETSMTTELIRTRGAESIEQTPLKRFGRPEEVVSAIAFLCSDAASFVTGEPLHVNGGLYMG